MGGPDKSSLAELVTVPRADFETKIAAPGTPAVVQVEGLDSNGAVIGRSPLVKPKQP
jgi:hypothetical protein